VRTTKRGQQCRLVACTNPGGEGNDWVMERWAAWLDPGHSNPAEEGDLRYYKRDADDNDIECEPDDPRGTSRTFIAAGLQDNPYLRDTDYARTLEQLPEPYRSQLKDGNWQAGMVDDAYQVIPTAWIKAAQARWTPERPAGTPLSMLAVDVARGGADNTVLSKRYGTWFAPLEVHPGKSTPDGQSVAGLTMIAMEPGAYGSIDVIGVGASAYDILTMKGQYIIPVNFAEGSKGTDKSGRLHFANKRAEYYWHFREMLDPAAKDPIALPRDPLLLAELRAARWKMGLRGLQIEDKEHIKERLNRSPDRADGVVMAGSTGGHWIGSTL